LDVDSDGAVRLGRGEFFADAPPLLVFLAFKYLVIIV
jgi:hypothetical protein